LLITFYHTNPIFQAIEAKSVLGRHDTSMFLKAQMDNLQGRNDELRLALREVRHESNKAALEYEKAMEKVSGFFKNKARYLDVQNE